MRFSLSGNWYRESGAGGAGEAEGVGAGLTDNLWRKTDNLTKPALLGDIAG
ncbi:hypothetical protein [Coleofasciculus sp. F4-SAH-05]|uniref:hypothetical protein n=1 Tax=Coleofasciculus sp. F4-SAH-05 TaxID=3069525 RepID=UPI0032FDD0CF